MVKNVVLIRNIFYKCFAIGFLFLIFTNLVYMLDKNWILNLTANLFNVSRQDVSLLMVYFISCAKLLNIYIFLIPALALHWTGHVLKKTEQ